MSSIYQARYDQSQVHLLEQSQVHLLEHGAYSGPVGTIMAAKVELLLKAVEEEVRWIECKMWSP